MSCRSVQQPQAPRHNATRPQHAILPPKPRSRRPAPRHVPVECAATRRSLPVGVALEHAARRTRTKPAAACTAWRTTSMWRNRNGGKGRSGSGSGGRGSGSRWASRKKQRRKRPWLFESRKASLVVRRRTPNEGRHTALHVGQEFELGQRVFWVYVGAVVVSVGVRRARSSRARPCLCRSWLLGVRSTEEAASM